MNKLFLGAALAFALIACEGNTVKEQKESEPTEPISAEMETIPSEKKTEVDTNMLKEIEADVDSIGGEIDNVIKDLK